MKATKPLAQPLAAKLPARRSSALRQVGLVKPLTKPLVRPLTRGDCEDGPRPCTFDCRYRLHHPDETCALDVADVGAMTQERVAELMGVSQQRVDYLEKRALRKARGCSG